MYLNKRLEEILKILIKKIMQQHKKSQKSLIYQGEQPTMT